MTFIRGRSIGWTEKKQVPQLRFGRMTITGDRAKIETYVKTVDHSQAVDGMLAFRTQTGGFDLLSIESSEPLHIRFRVKEKAGAYDTITDGDVFAERLTTDLQAVSHDKHLRVNFSPFKTPPRGKPTPGRRGALPSTDGARQLRLPQS